MIKFQKNKTQLFECKIKIEGADKNTAKPRLILYPQNDTRNIFFEGIIENDICKIRILPNLSISETGKAVLEVIIEDSIIFKPWTAEYEILTEKVMVEAVHVSNSNIGASVKVLDDEVKIDDKKLVSEIKKPIKQKANQKPKQIIKKKKSFDDLLQEAASMIKDDTKTEKGKLFTEDELIKAYTDSIKSLNKEDLEKMVKHVQINYVPKKESVEWAKKVLGESKSTKAKLLMYCNEIKK